MHKYREKERIERVKCSFQFVFILVRNGARARWLNRKKPWKTVKFRAIWRISLRQMNAERASAVKSWFPSREMQLRFTSEHHVKMQARKTKDFSQRGIQQALIFLEEATRQQKNQTMAALTTNSLLNKLKVSIASLQLLLQNGHFISSSRIWGV